MLLGWSLISPVYALDPASIEAQQLLRQQEQERALRERQEAQPDVHVAESMTEASKKPALEAARLPDQEAPCFTIKQIALTGELAEQFQWSLSAANFYHDEPDPAIGQCLGDKGVDIVMARVQRAIIDHGFVTTRVLLAPQKLNSGTLALSVIPGRIHRIRFADDVSRRAPQANALPMKPGDLLNLRDIEQALENFRRVPTATVDIKITPAEDSKALNASDLVISWQQSRPFRLSAFADDSGSRTTGKYQGGITLSLDHPLALNDLFYITLNHDMGGGMAGDRGTRGHTLHYSFPYANWLFSATYNAFHYHQNMPGAFKHAVYSGESENGEIKLNRLLYRSRALKTTAALRLWSRQARSFVDTHEQRGQQRRMAGWEASIQQRFLIHAAMLDMTLAYRRGTGMLNTLAVPEESYLIPEGSSRPEIITAETTLTLPFKIKQQTLQYSLNARGQWNQTPLIPQDRFSIGSRYSVRGFDGETSLTGERGYFLRNELSWTLGASGQNLYTGIDYGEIGGPSSRKQLGKRLMGAVIGLRGGFKGFTYDFFASHTVKQPEHFHAPSPVACFSASYQY